MDRPGWLWKKRSSEKSPDETEISRSVSSASERFSDEQSNLTQNTQSPEVTSRAASNDEENENMKSLAERLSAALLSVGAKEELVKQHAKVAEEAVAGWEKAEREASGLKLQLDASLKKNSALEDRVEHLDGALKECVRQLRQGREEQNRKIEEAITKREREWESRKSELENQICELRAQLESAMSEAEASIDGLRPKLEASEKENSSLRLELAALSKKLEVTTLERDLSTQTAENASKQHLESFKKVARLEAECRRLNFLNRKASVSGGDHKSPNGSSPCVDSRSDCGGNPNFVRCSSKIVLMDDFDEMEKLAASQNARNGPLSLGSSDKVEEMAVRIADLEKKIEKLEAEKMELRSALKGSSTRSEELEAQLSECSAELQTSEAQLKATKTELMTLKNQFYECLDEFRASESELKELQTQRIERDRQLKESQEQLEDAEAELRELQSQVTTSQGELKISQEQVKDSESQLLEVQTRLGEYEEKLRKSQLESRDVEMKLVELQTELAMANEVKELAELRVEALESEVRSLLAKVEALTDEAAKERGLSAEMRDECRRLEDELSKKKLEPDLRLAFFSCNSDMKAEQEKELAVAAGKLADCQSTIASLGRQLQSLAALDDFLMDADFPGESPEFSGTDELGRPPSIDCQ